MEDPLSPLWVVVPLLAWALFGLAVERHRRLSRERKERYSVTRSHARRYRGPRR